MLLPRETIEICWWWLGCWLEFGVGELGSEDCLGESVRRGATWGGSRRRAGGRMLGSPFWSWGGAVCLAMPMVCHLVTMNVYILSFTGVQWLSCDAPPRLGEFPSLSIVGLLSFEHQLHRTTSLPPTMDNLNPIDPWAAPATKVAAFIGVFWVSYKILSFWRMIASLFILPGQSVCVQVKSMTLKSSTNV